jgi:hypothetical protein
MNEDRKTTPLLGKEVSEMFKIPEPYSDKELNCFETKAYPFKSKPMPISPDYIKIRKIHLVFIGIGFLIILGILINIAISLHEIRSEQSHIRSDISDIHSVTEDIGRTIQITEGTIK